MTAPPLPGRVAILGFGNQGEAQALNLKDSGCDVIVTDHHGTSENVARCHTILNPRLPDAGYPDRELAGCGVAFPLFETRAPITTRAWPESFIAGDMAMESSSVNS